MQTCFSNSKTASPPLLTILKQPFKTMQRSNIITIRASRLCGTAALALILCQPAAQAEVSIISTYSGAAPPTLNNTYGTLEFALNIGGNALTRDGIAFTAADTKEVLSTRTFLSGPISVVGTALGGATWQTFNLDGDPLFNTVAYANSDQGYTIDLTGLNASKTYQIQLLFADPRPGSYPYTETLSISDDLDPVPNITTVTVTYGKASTGDEFTVVTAIVKGTTKCKFTSPSQATGGPLLSGLVLQSIR